MTQRAIAEIVGLSRTSLKKYPQIRAIFGQVKEMRDHDNKKRFQLRETELVNRIRETASLFESLGKPVTQRAIGESIGMTPSGLKHYPRARTTLEQVTAKHRHDTKIKSQQGNESRAQQREDELIKKVHKVVGHLASLGKPMTQQAISQAVGMSPRSLKRYPRVRTILEQLAEERRRGTQWRVQRLEDELVEKVENAIKHLEHLEQPVTQQAIGEIVAMSPSGMKRYPRVKTILAKVVKHTPGRTN